MTDKLYIGFNDQGKSYSYEPYKKHMEKHPNKQPSLFSRFSATLHARNIDRETQQIIANITEELQKNSANLSTRVDQYLSSSHQLSKEPAASPKSLHLSQDKKNPAQEKKSLLDECDTLLLKVRASSKSPELQQKVEALKQKISEKA